MGSLLLRHRTTGRVPLASEAAHTAIAESSNSDCEGAMERAIRPRRPGTARGVREVCARGARGASERGAAPGARRLVKGRDCAATTSRIWQIIINTTHPNTLITLVTGGRGNDSRGASASSPESSQGHGESGGGWNAPRARSPPQPTPIPPHPTHPPTLGLSVPRPWQTQAVPPRVVSRQVRPKPPSPASRPKPPSPASHVGGSTLAATSSSL